jgi:hypothetical protein
VQAAAIAAPVGVMAVGYSKRDDLTINEVELKVPGLAKDLQGLRIVQLSDIHLSPQVPVKLLERAVAMANETNPHVAIVTGDLITRYRDPLDDCIRKLALLRSDSLTLGCLGNHEIYADAEDYTAQEAGKFGIEFLRDARRTLTFGDARIAFSGVDYQHRQAPYLQGVERLKQRGALNILLSHNPDVFPVAVEKGFDITLAGHTHGGQVTFEILHPSLNVARFYTPYIHGVYTQPKGQVFVTRGVGTIGVPARLGAPPEIALIRLCAA